MPTPTVRTVRVRGVTVGGSAPLAVIAGPCVLEDRDTNLRIAEHLKTVTERLGLGYIFKASYDKGNRAVSASYRGPLLEGGLRQLDEIRRQFDVPVLTDVHTEEEAVAAAEVVDVLQIPAFLCMQTALVERAAGLGKPLNVKKGQFLAPQGAAGIVKKVRDQGNQDLMLTERGTTFGYNGLVADLRSLPIMRALGVPVVFDPTHIVRRPGLASSDPAGGEPEFVGHLTRAAVAAGIDALFLETHPEPRRAKCDASSMLPLHRVEELLRQAKALDEAVKVWDLGLPVRGEDGFLS